MSRVIGPCVSDVDVSKHSKAGLSSWRIDLMGKPASWCRGCTIAYRAFLIGKRNPGDSQRVTRFLLLVLDVVREMDDASRLVLAGVGRMC